MASRETLQRLRRDIARLRRRFRSPALIITGIVPAEEAEGLRVLELPPDGTAHVVLYEFTGAPPGQAARSGEGPRV